MLRATQGLESPGAALIENRLFSPDFLRGSLMALRIEK
jgi:hypothetical protein